MIAVAVDVPDGKAVADQDIGVDGLGLEGGLRRLRRQRPQQEGKAKESSGGEFHDERRPGSRLRE